LDIAFDGADEIDSSLNLIKGGGGCLLQEKLVASAAKKFVIIVDESKDSPNLGVKWKVPIEVVPCAYNLVIKKLQAMGGKAKLREGSGKAGPVVTDNGNFILDADFGVITDPHALDQELIKIPGIVETGLFAKMAHAIYIGKKDDTVECRNILDK
jgi:ribose 5-phosphate isomerase A